MIDGCVFDRYADEYIYNDIVVASVIYLNQRPIATLYFHDGDSGRSEYPGMPDPDVYFANGYHFPMCFGIDLIPGIDDNDYYYLKSLGDVENTIRKLYLLADPDRWFEFTHISEEKTFALAEGFDINALDDNLKEYNLKYGLQEIINLKKAISEQSEMDISFQDLLDLYEFGREIAEDITHYFIHRKRNLPSNYRVKYPHQDAEKGEIIPAPKNYLGYMLKYGYSPTPPHK